jgi:hypothetical protein
MMRRFSGGGERDQPPRERGDGSGDPQRGRSRGSGGPGGRSNAENPGSPELKSERKDSRSTASTAKPRTPINVKLPDQYRSRDTDGDGQIGFYEWPRSDFAGFRRLDLNGDGYLTPKELLRGPGPSAMPRTESNSQASAAPVVATSSTGASGPSASGSAPTGDNGPKNPAETAFKLLDKNKDGSISEEEWKKSLSTGPAIAKAGITVSLPLSRNEFFRLYPQAYPNSVKK